MPPVSRVTTVRAVILVLCVLALEGVAQAGPPTGMTAAVDGVILIIDRRELAILDLPTPNAAFGAIHDANAYYLAGEAQEARQRIEPTLLHRPKLAEVQETFCGSLRAELPMANCEIVAPEGLASAIGRQRGASRVMLFDLRFATTMSFATLQLTGSLTVGRPHPRKPKLTRRELNLPVASDFALVARSPATARHRHIDQWIENDSALLDTALGVMLRDLAIIAQLAASRPPEQWCKGPRIAYRRVSGYGRGWRMDERGERSYVYGESEMLLGMRSKLTSRTIRARIPCPAP